MNETVGNAALQEFTEVAKSIPQLSEPTSGTPSPVIETRSQKMSRIMKEIRAKKKWNSLPKKKDKRPYIRRQPVERSSISQIDAKIDNLLKQITVLRAAKKLLTR